MTELLASGKENFELDHFCPRALRPDLVSQYDNLYYACHVCNHTKLDKWPDAELEARGFRFFDSCADEFTTHFRDEDGEWIPLTPVGEYSVERLRLNRTDLVDLRRILRNLLGRAEIDWDLPLSPQINERVARIIASSTPLT